MIHDTWKAELQNGLPLPESTYCSPLRRALETNEIIFGSLLSAGQRTTIIDVCQATLTQFRCHFAQHLPLELPPDPWGTHLRPTAVAY